MRKQNEERLQYWQGVLSRAEGGYSAELERMDKREALYRGDGIKLEPLIQEHIKDHRNNEVPYHIRNIIAENIESEIDSNIPQPKVVPRRKRDEERARIIEDLIRNELDRMPMEELNDIMERMVPIQGGGYWLLEWDNSAGTFYRTGENTVSIVHPKAVVPQTGIVSSIDDMDYIILKQAESKRYVKSRYGVDVSDEGESESEIRVTADDASSTSDNIVTVYTAYYKTEDGKINKFSWVNDVVIEDIEDYQARRHRRCADCGNILPASDDKIREMLKAANQTEDIEAELSGAIIDIRESLGIVDDAPEVNTESAKEDKGIKCPYCGSKQIKESSDDYEEIIEGFSTRMGINVPDAKLGVDKNGKPCIIPTKIPAYKPDVYPVILQKNISLYGSLLGDSDVDKIEDLQNALNWHIANINENLLGMGSVIALPKSTHITRDSRNNRVWYVDNPQDLATAQKIDFTSNLQYNFAQVEGVYESARQILGITDSFQGRRDTTATSGKAKEFAAAQSAGRLESKRMLKAAAWARLFELIFKFTLAYADEPRNITGYDDNGDITYDTFNRYDFLEYDEETGEYYWDDDFIFSCDSSAPLASNREAMWSECRQMFQSGAYGDPSSLDTLVLFWSEMERLHYPLANAAKKHILEIREQRANAQMLMQSEYAALAPPTEKTGTGAAFISPDGQTIN